MRGVALNPKPVQWRARYRRNASNRKMMNYLLVGLSALVLVIGWKLGTLAIMGGSVTRDEQPRLFWGAMALTALIGFGGVALIATGH